MFCKNCGKEIEEGSRFCKHCGQKLFEEEVQQNVPVRKPKSQFVAIALCLIFGIIGLHDFYLEHHGSGIFKLLILICLGWIGIGFAINIFLCVCDFLAIILKTKPYNKVFQ